MIVLIWLINYSTDVFDSFLYLFKRSAHSASPSLEDWRLGGLEVWRPQVGGYCPPDCLPVLSTTLYWWTLSTCSFYNIVLVDIVYLFSLQHCTLQHCIGGQHCKNQGLEAWKFTKHCKNQGLEACKFTKHCKNRRLEACFMKSDKNLSPGRPKSSSRGVPGGLRHLKAAKPTPGKRPGRAPGSQNGSQGGPGHPKSTEIS